MNYNKILKQTAIIIIIGSIVACGPVYRTETKIYNPTDDPGLNCANQCLYNRAQCQQNCRHHLNICRNNATLNSAVDIIGEIAQKRENGSNKYHYYKNLCQEDFNQCSNECENIRLDCHVLCGGRVERQRICVSGCE